MNKQPNEERAFTVHMASDAMLKDNEESDSAISDKEPPRDKKRRRQEMTEEERREERRTANRRSAFESRHRRKVLIEELQGAVESLSKENAAIRKEADSLRVEVHRLTTENRRLHLQQQLSRSISVSGVPDSGTPRHNPDMWSLQQGVSQGLHMNMGMPGLPALNRFVPGDTNIGPLLGRNSLDRIPNDMSIADQAREFLRDLQRRQGPTG